LALTPSRDKLTVRRTAAAQRRTRHPTRRDRDAMALATPKEPFRAIATTPGELDRLITAACREQMAAVIAGNGGGEVFFIGRLNPARVVEAVEPLAFGNRGAVPALLPYARPGDVCIHNHPSGRLEPSEADIAVASELGGRGVGSYIINNDCTALRIIVRALEPPTLQPISVGKLANWLKPGGRLAERLAGFEYRPQQIEMLQAVGEAFNSDGIALIEAGTGTGKSMAYLLPAIAWAIRNNEKVVIATGTINLQEQLIEKDIPLLLQNSGLQFEATLMKGRNNYLCRRKAQYLREHPDFLQIGEKAAQLAEIQAWIRTTRTGSLEDLPFTPDPEVWESVMSEADNCLRTRCPFYDTCFFYTARRRAARAQVLVVNHHLLMADMAIRAETENYSATAVLPPYQRLIVDEAHNLEEVATSYFGVRVSRGSLAYCMRRLFNTRRNDGLLIWLAGRIHNGEYPVAPQQHDELLLKLGRDLPLQHHELLTAMEEATGRLAEALERTERTPLHQPLEIKRRIKTEDLAGPFWREEIDAPLRAVVTAARPYLENLRAVGRALLPFLEEASPELATPLLELQSSLNKVEAAIGRLIKFLGSAEGQCRWIEYRRRPGGRLPDVTYCLAPLNMAAELRENLLRRCRTVVMTSATLTVDQRFDYLLRQIGAEDPLQLGLIGPTAAEASASAAPGGEELEPPPAEPFAENATSAAEIIELIPPLPSDASAEPDELPPPRARPFRALILATPFDYERQVYVGVPMDMAEPTDPRFEEALTGFLGPTLEISRGRAFVLFTSYALLGRVFDRLAPGLEARGYPCLRQGTIGRSMLTEAFRNEIGSILFATSSFWEGVDVAGEALSCLVLTRLPFKVPGDPLTEARIEDLRRRRLDPFYHLVIPQAVIKFRQGFGRLIRTKTDRGAVLICDPRVATRRYGQIFLRSLPTQRIHFARQSELLDALRTFYDDQPGRDDD